jgi:uncharacterized membrane protein YhiD involved in acid resistance
MIPELMMPDMETLIRLVTTADLGSQIGFERERLLWAAGCAELTSQGRN